MSGLSSWRETPVTRSTSSTLRGGNRVRIQNDGAERCKSRAAASLAGPPAVAMARRSASSSGVEVVMPPTVEVSSTVGNLYQRGSLNLPARQSALPSAPMTKSIHKRQVGQNLRIVREALGLSQQQLADKLGLSDKSQLSHWERGLYYPDPYIVWRLWEDEGVTADWIYLGQRRNLPSWLADGLKSAGAASSEPAVGAASPVGETRSKTST